MQDRYDSVLLGILQNEGDMPKFLNVFFSFLYRRTDYYVHLTSPQGKMGFPPGVAKKMLLAAFKRYDELAAKDNARRLEVQQRAVEKRQQEEEQAQKQQENIDVPDCAQEEEVSMMTEEKPYNDSSLNAVDAGLEVTNASSIEASSVPLPSSQNQADSSEHEPITASCDKLPTTSCDKPVTSCDTAARVTADVAALKTSDVSEKDSVAPSASTDPDEEREIDRLQKIFQANPESYNGAIRDKYSWAQSITDIDIRVKVPQSVRRAKDVTVDISRKHLRVTYKDTVGAVVVVVDDQLSWDINKEESMWSLVPGEHIHINVEKFEERWWESLIVSEPKISMRKIDASRPMSDLEEGAQAKIDEMMYNEEQKRLGRPQTHETKVHEMLRKSWDAEGSPFKGQPFDPSQINISPSSMG